MDEKKKYIHTIFEDFRKRIFSHILYRVRVMVFNANFNISVILWRPVLLVEET
jgi:hypothetical protein